MTDIVRLTTAELDALTGAGLWGEGSRLGGDAGGGEIGDHPEMSEADIRTMEIECKRCGRPTTHEVSATGEEGVSVADCLRCREIEAEARALVEQRQRAAEVAQRADQLQRTPAEVHRDLLLRESAERKTKRDAQPWRKHFWPVALGGFLVLAAIGAVFGKKKPDHGEDTEEQSTACGNKSAAAIQNATNLARRVCECATPACASAVIRDADVTSGVIETMPCSGGFSAHQLAEIERQIVRGQVCIDRLSGR